MYYFSVVISDWFVCLLSSFTAAIFILLTLR